MIQFLGRLFSSPKAIKQVASTTRSALDSLVYTDQEKAHDAAKDRAASRQYIIKWLEATQGQNLARRTIAMSILSLWLLTFFAAIMCSIAAVWVTDSTQLRESAAILLSFAGEMSTEMALIMGFYFAAPYMGQIANTYVANKTKNNANG